MMINDAMAIIHLAKLTLLEKSCTRFREVSIPEKVYGEIMCEDEKKYAEIRIIATMIRDKKIKIKAIKNKAFIKRANELNIQGGEAEAAALCWQEKAKYLATDDDNVRKKKLLLNVSIIGTPAIILKLYKEKRISKEKFQESIAQLRKIGWFSNAILDKMLMGE